MVYEDAKPLLDQQLHCLFEIGEVGPGAVIEVDGDGGIICGLGGGVLGLRDVAWGCYRRCDVVGFLVAVIEGRDE